MSGARPAKGERKKAKQPTAEVLFGKHMKELGITYGKQVPVVEGRKFAWDYVLYVGDAVFSVEIDGYFKGRHGAGWGSDNEKMNLGTLAGWRQLRFSTSFVNDGRAKAWIAKNLLNLEG